VRSRIRIAGALLALSLLSACQTTNDVAKAIGKPPENAVALRALQTRRFDSQNDKVLLEATTQTLQDLGFTISEASSDVGVIVASKQRDAHESGQVAAQIGLTIMMALLGGVNTPTWDQEQTIRVTVSALPVSNARQTEVRTSFDRILINNHGHAWKAELLMEPQLYKEFFEKLSAAAFLEAHQI